jgi:hypothetical protein
MEMEERCEHCYEDLVAHHHRNLRCPGDRKTIYRALPEPVYWNPYNKVVQDHRDGTIYDDATNDMRAKQGLPVPWTPAIGKFEVYATEDKRLQ